MVAASDSEWKDVSTIQAMGRKKTIPASQATRPQAAELPWRARRRPDWAGDAVGGAHARDASSRNRDETTRSAKVAMMIEPMTTRTPAAEARPFSWAW